MKNEAITVSEFNALVNQTLGFAYPEVVVEGEVASFKVNQAKWVFFDLKDEDNAVGCFMPIFQLKTAIEDGMKVRVVAVPQLTKWGKFSLTVRAVELSGEGSMKRAFELLRAKLDAEGLFEPSRKRALPEFPERVLLITSKQAAAYNDFIAIINDRWCGIVIDHLQVQVQGEKSPQQIVDAIEYANRHNDKYDAVVLIRGGGSAEDLLSFNTEEVARAVFGCIVPIVVAIGHEDDVSLAELAADLRGATPTDAARRLVPDKKAIIVFTRQQIDLASASIATHAAADRALLNRFYYSLELRIAGFRQNNAELQKRNENTIELLLDRLRVHQAHLLKLLKGLDPRAILERGYSIARIDGRVVKSSTAIKQNDIVVLQLHQGSVLLTKPQRSEDDEQEQTAFRL